MTRKTSPKISHLVFDLDGVVWETFPREPFQLLTKAADVSDPQIQAVCTKLRGRSFRGTDWISELREAGVDVRDKLLMANISNHLFQKTKHSLWLYYDIGPVICELAKRTRLSVFSNNCRAALEYSLPELVSLFECVITFESLAPENLKPHPQGLWIISRQSNTPISEIYLIGNTRDDVDAARAAGTQIAIAKWRWQRQNKLFDPRQFGEDGEKLVFLDYPSSLLDIIPEKNRVE
jgi:beta-phosphoglucomutase-like phosphatase (HAD superfamily)